MIKYSHGAALFCNYSKEVLDLMKTVYLYVFNTMADWEIGYLTAELNSGRYFRKGMAPIKIVTAGIDHAVVCTMGGLKILPDITLDACSFENGEALILPGGDTWTDEMHEPVLKMAERRIEEGTLVAAICGATIGLARTGVLNSHQHTSNDLGYLKMICPSYTGENHYVNEPAVTDGNLITASGIAPLDFSMHVMKALGVFSEETLAAWYNLYKTHETKYFFELMNAVR